MTKVYPLFGRRKPFHAHRVEKQYIALALVSGPYYFVCAIHTPEMTIPGWDDEDDSYLVDIDWYVAFTFEYFAHCLTK